MSHANEYTVRVSVLGRPFQEIADFYGETVNPGPLPLIQAWAYKKQWEKDHEGHEPEAEVVHLGTGRVVNGPLIVSMQKMSLQR